MLKIDSVLQMEKKYVQAKIEEASFFLDQELANFL